MRKLGKQQILNENEKKTRQKMYKRSAVTIIAMCLFLVGCGSQTTSENTNPAADNLSETSEPKETQKVAEQEKNSAEATEASEKDVAAEAETKESTGSNGTTTETLATNTPASPAWEETYKDDKKYYVSSDYLKENAEYYIGKVVVTVVEVGKVKSGYFKVSSGLTTAYEIDMADNEETDSLSKGKKVAIIGKVKDVSDIVEKVTILDSYILAVDDVSEYVEEINEQADKQKSYVQKKVETEQKKAVAAAQAEMDSYKNSCTWPDYNQVQRKPNKFKGTRTFIFGEVIQSLEGYFDTVSLRVQDGDGNVWWVEYCYDEEDDRILEGDYVQIFGECTGTTTYETTFGDTVTVPSIDARYVELSIEDTSISYEDDTSSQYESEYILPNSDNCYLTEADVSWMSSDMLRLARNEIYARHGRIFDSADLNQYFNSQSWYLGLYTANEFDESWLNKYEKANINLIKSYE